MMWAMWAEIEEARRQVRASTRELEALCAEMAADVERAPIFFWLGREAEAVGLERAS